MVLYPLKTNLDNYPRLFIDILIVHYHHKLTMIM